MRPVFSFIDVCISMRMGWALITDLFRQLTLMEHELFLQITPADIYYKSSKDVAKGGRRLTDMIDHFNKVCLLAYARGPTARVSRVGLRARLVQISFWVAKEICGAPNLKQRVSFLKLFVHLAYVCHARVQTGHLRLAVPLTLDLATPPPPHPVGTLAGQICLENRNYNTWCAHDGCPRADRRDRSASLTFEMMRLVVRVGPTFLVSRLSQA